MLRPQADYERLAEVPLVPYVDTVLRTRRRKYVEFVKALYALGLLVYLDHCIDEVGVFFVLKKDGVTRRLIIEIGRASCRERV